MTLHFGYIEGLSRIDTPYFANIAEQDDYFDSHEVVSIESSFYPPHYLNEIKVDTEDCDFNDNVNYVWFTFNNKTYYYFIDDIEYISETVIKLYISMDTIQTYMFNIKLSNGIIQRKFINRWVNGSINRNYIRENVSNNLFHEVEYTIYNNDRTHWMYFMKATNAIDAASGPFIDTMGDVSSTLGYYENGQLYNFEAPYMIYFSYNVAAQCRTGQTETVWNNIPTVGVAFPVTCGAYVIPFECLFNVSMRMINGTAYITGPVNKSKKDFNHTEYNFFWQSALLYVSKINTTPYSFNFVQNSKVNKVFDTRYMIQMFDENYIKFTFGDNAYYTEYPLHLLTTSLIYCAYWADVGSGNRYYNITVDANHGTINTYNTIVENPAALTLDLKNKPWEEYIARNKNALTSAMISDVGNYASIAGNMAMAGDSYSNNLQMVASNDKYWDRRYKTPHLKNKYKDSVTRMKQDYDQSIKKSGFDAASTSSQTLNYFINQGNLKASPSSIKQNGDISKDINGLLWAIGHRYSKCNDYDACANYFHRNGFLVNEHVNSIDNIFNYVQNRFYFNVLKMNDVDLHLRNIIEDDNTLDSIKDRLEKGMRLWNVNNVHSDWYLQITLTSLTPTDPLPQEGDTITIDFACQGDPVITGVITRIQYDEYYTVPVSLEIKCNKVNISQPENFSTLTFNGTQYTIDYSIQSVRWEEDRATVTMGSFRYDNVEIDYLN